MSRTLSKILVICAMVVVFPLMIVGTAFASFYSIEATTVVEVYAGTHDVPTDAFAQVRYGEEAKGKLTISEGHLNEIQIKALSNGYDFIGWYDGTVQEYTEDETPEFVSAEETLKISASDYENLVAVFEIKSYTLSWNYVENPENASNVTTTAPQSAKAVYYWGDTLPELAYDHYDFKGWTVDGDTTFYTAAKFANSGAVTVKALENSWQSHGQVNVNYYDENKNIIASATEKVYKGSVVIVKNPANILTLVDGYKYSWKDVNGFTLAGNFTVSKEFEGENVDLYLKKEVATYTANIVENAEASYKTKAVSFTVENTASLEDLFVEENWNKYSFHEIAGFTFSGTKYTSAADLANAIVASSKNGNAIVELDVEIQKYFETFTANEVVFVSTGSAVYQEGESIEYSISGAVSAASTATIEELLNIKDLTFVNDNEDNAEVVDVATIRIAFTNGTFSDFTVTRETVLNDVIEAVLAKHSVANAGVITIAKLTVNFA